MSLNILTPHVDSLRWKAAVQAMPECRRDLHYLPEYACLHTRVGEQAMAALYQDAGGTVLYPFILRPVFIGGEPVIVDGRPAQEIVAPYGIGGPICSSEHDTEMMYTHFDVAFRDWCKQEGWASEFLCPHLFTGTLETIQRNATYISESHKNVVILPLGCLPEDLWRQCNKGHKYAIKLARRNDIILREIKHPDSNTYQAMLDIYYDTMQRQNAAARWYIDPEYFKQCSSLLGDAHCTFFCAYQQKVMIAWNIMLHDSLTMYYHYAGSTLKGQKAGAPTALLHLASLRAQEMGLTRLYMGGGASDAPDDPVYRFKHGFTKNTQKFYIAWRILNDTVYKKLCDAKIVYEKRVGYIAKDQKFFPLYRR